MNIPESRGVIPYSARVFVVCLIGWILSNMDQSFFGYAIPSIMTEFGIGLPVIGNILSAAFILAAFSIVGIGLLADRYGRRRLFVVCLGSSALLVGLQFFAKSLWLIALLRCLAFAFSTGLVPVVNALVAEAAPPRWRGVLTGLVQCGYPIGWFISSMAAAPLLHFGGWRYMFLPALLVVPLAFLLARFLPESALFEQRRRDSSAADTQMTSRERIAILFGHEYRRRTILCSLTFFLFGGAYAGTAFYFPTFFQVVRGYSPEEATRVVGLSYGIGLLGYVSAAFVGEFVTTRRNTVVIWLLVGACAVTGVLYNGGGFYTNVIWFGLTAMFFYGAAAVLTTYAAEIFPTEVRATGVAVGAGLGINLGFAVFPVVVAQLVGSLGWVSTFLIAVVPALLLAGLLTLAQPNIRSGRHVDVAAGALSVADH